MMLPKIVTSSSFDFSTDRLNEFFTQFLNMNPKYTSLNTVCISIFVISHGQASVERGFNINKEMLVENMKELSLVRLRMVYDEIKASGYKSYNFPISNGIVVASKQASSKYKIELEKNKDSLVEASRQEKEEEISVVKRKRLAVDERLEIDAEKLYTDTEEKNKMELLIMANSLKKSCKEKQETMKDLDVVIDNLQEELKGI